MVSSPTVLLFKSEFKKYREPGTDICLNCPLAECVITGQMPKDIRKKREAPACPIEYAVYHRVNLQSAEWMATQTLAISGSRAYRNWAYRSVVRQAADRERSLKGKKNV